MAQEDSEIIQSQERGTAPEVSVKVGSEKGSYEIRIPAVNHLFADIERYNDQFSMGAMMARQLFAIVRFEDEEEPKTPTRLSQEKEHQKMTASALAVIHKDTLEKPGLALEPVSGKGVTLMALGEQAGEGQMRMNVVERNKFVSFLRALEPLQVRETGFKSNLESLSGVLTQQVFDNYNPPEAEERGSQLIDVLEKSHMRLEDITLR